MFWVTAGFLVLGAACGAAFRVLFFVAVLMVAAAVVVISDVLRGSPSAVIDAVIAVASLQVGYVMGIGMRAWVYARRHQPGMKTGRVDYTSVDAGRERR